MRERCGILPISDYLKLALREWWRMSNARPRRRRRHGGAIFVLLLVLAAALSLYITLKPGSSDPAASSPPAAPTESGDTPGVSASPIVSENPDTPDPVETPETPKFEILDMAEADIGRGDLILVNPQHEFTIPEDTGNVLINDYKSASSLLFDKDAVLPQKTIEAINRMLDDFKAETGLSNVIIYSAFRSLAKQQQIFDDRVAMYGSREEANKWAALPGFSEHHTGLAVDFAIYVDQVINTFKGEGAYAWITENAHKYGFFLRYKAEKTDITGTAYEPWHYRYVGVPHAYFIERRGYCYEEYMEYLMNFKYDGFHLNGYYDGDMYEIYYVRGTQVPVPTDREYTISGNNIDGFIVTIKNAE